MIKKLVTLYLILFLFCLLVIGVYFKFDFFSPAQ
jgi:hypothetical protein